MTIKQNGGVFGRNPTFNNVTIDGDLTVEGAVVHDGDLTVDNINLSGNTISTTNTNGDLLLDPNGTGKVGVNELSPDRTFSVTAAAVIPVRFESTGRDNQLEFANSVGTPKIGSFDDNFLIFTGGSETVRVDSSGHLIVPAGITLGTATGVHTTANTLDDYEEGVFTPTYSTTGTDFTSVTYDSGSTEGSYTKIGNMVNVRISMRTSAVTIGSASGTVLISGLPFTASSNKNATGCYGSLFAGDNPRVGRAVGTTVYLYYRTAGSTGDIPLAPADLGTGANNNDVIISLSYQTS